MKKRELKSKNNQESAAILTIKDVNNMTKEGRRDIAEWLRRQADDLEQLWKRLR